MLFLLDVWLLDILLGPQPGRPVPGGLTAFVVAAFDRPSKATENAYYAGFFPHDRLF